jgi:hypothetical protein
MSPCSLVAKDRLFTRLHPCYVNSRFFRNVSKAPPEATLRSARQSTYNGRSICLLHVGSFRPASNSDSRADCHLACFFCTNASLADMLSDGRGAERGDPLAAVRDVTGRGYLTIARALFVPQNEEVEMERPLLLRGVTFCGHDKSAWRVLTLRRYVLPPSSG